MLSFEELAVLLSLETDLGLEKSTVAHYALGLYSGDKFDRNVALIVMDNLRNQGLISRDNSGFYYITPKGALSIQKTKNCSRDLMKRLLLG